MIESEVDDPEVGQDQHFKKSVYMVSALNYLRSGKYNQSL
jgi:hypothetical protein